MLAQIFGSNISKYMNMPNFSNSESWINITKLDLDILEKSDAMLHQNILSDHGNLSKVFMLLELGTIPVRFVMMEKRLTF